MGKAPERWTNSIKRKTVMATSSIGSTIMEELRESLHLAVDRLKAEEEVR